MHFSFIIYSFRYKPNNSCCILLKKKSNLVSSNGAIATTSNNNLLFQPLAGTIFMHLLLVLPVDAKHTIRYNQPANQLLGC